MNNTDSNDMSSSTDGRFETFDVERVALWARDMDGGIIKQFEQDGGWTIEINGDLAVVEKQEE